MIYLYIKQHSVTGLKYFGKTVRKNPFKYNGSGKYWTSHIVKHGIEYVKTIELYSFDLDKQDLCTEFALKFSQDNNIVESENWANLCEENGIGGISGFKFTEQSKKKMSNSAKGKIISEETRKRISKANKGKIQSEKHSQHSRTACLGKIHKPESIEKMRKSSTGKFHSQETKDKLSKIGKGRPHSEEHKLKLKIARNKRAPISEETRIKMIESWKIRRLKAAANQINQA